MHSTDEIDVAPKNARLHIVSGDHVVRNQQELLTFDPRIVLLDHGGKLWNPSGRRVARKDQVQNRHEVALTATEAAVQISSFARVPENRPLDEVQRIIKGQHELRRRHIGSDGRLWIGDPFGQSQNELSLVDVLGNID